MGHSYHQVERNLFGLAPGGGSHAPDVAIRAVSSYLAFSPLPCTITVQGGIFSVALSFCPLFTEETDSALRSTLPYGARTFLPPIGGGPSGPLHPYLNFFFL